MTEITICGRGGQGGVTLAKLIATTYFLRDKHVQAFGVYAAERSGAPLQAFVRIDDREITNHNQVREPDHIVVLDRTLINPDLAAGMKPGGWIIVNAPGAPEGFAEHFPGRRVATVDATSIATANGLGTRTVPIVNTTMLGAVGRMLDVPIADVLAALKHLNFIGANEASAQEAYANVRSAALSGEVGTAVRDGDGDPVVGLLDAGVGGMPKIRTGSWATRIPKRRQLTPPCNQGCPAGNDVRSFVEAVGRDDADRALSILLATSPLPGVCGRVCPAPCMDACNRSEHDGSVNIRDIERYAADHGTRPSPTSPWRSESVAVVGSGPAGLSAAYHLARLGYPVSLFEGEDELGGVLRTGIPAYRLPRDVLERETAYVLQHGVEAFTGRFLSRSDLLRLTREHAAVFAATGLQDSRTLDLGNAGLDYVEQGIQFLDRVRSGVARLDDQRVIVIGGGNTAVDAARSALRVGARQVRIVYRRTRKQMPAIREEIDEAIEEGVALDELVSPLRLENHGMGPTLTCQRMKLGRSDASGRPRPIPDTTEGSQFDLPCDRVILALGQSTDISILPEGSEIHEGESLLGLSGAPLFAGGDFATNEGTVAAAIGSGRKAAWHIHRTVTGEDLFPPPAEPVATPDQITMHVFAHHPPEEVGIVEPADRRRTFTEVRTGFSDRADHRPAVEEAGRCFSCGVCNTCDWCLEYCPEGILLRDGDGYRFDYGYCKGCGVCATACPRGVIFMSEL
ncbi:MAG: 2-oxoacid:acceptor oxidoreductase family protein [Phycisphaerae bacterium]